LFDPGVRISISWMREVEAIDWLIDERSKSYLAVLPAQAQDALIADLAELIWRRFPVGRMAVRYVTFGWIARRS
jgi:hypothetical protein